MLNCFGLKMCIASRYVVVILCSLGMCLLHAQRVNVAVTVVTILDEAPHRKVGTIEAMMSVSIEAYLCFSFIYFHQNNTKNVSVDLGLRSIQRLYFVKHLSD